jgi:hypothetical protein
VKRGYLATIGLLLVLGCPGAKPIKQLLDDPAKYDGQNVRIAGEVKEAAGVLGYGGYTIDDGTGTLTVVTQGGGTPRVGARIGVEGTFRAAFTIGNRSVAVLMEKQRRGQ